MASPQASQKIGAELLVQSHDHDPGATTAVLAGPDGGTTIRYVDMRDYSNFAVMAKPNIVAAGGLTKLEIVASADTAFGTVTVIKDSGTVAGDALQDNVFLECTDEELAQEGSDGAVELRYAAARLTMATNTDEATVTYIAIPKRPHLNLTATAIT